MRIWIHFFDRYNWETLDMKKEVMTESQLFDSGRYLGNFKDIQKGANVSTSIGPLTFC